MQGEQKSASDEVQIKRTTESTQLPVYASTRSIWRNELPSFASSISVMTTFWLGHKALIESANLRDTTKQFHFAILSAGCLFFTMGHWGFISLARRNSKGLTYDPNGLAMRAHRILRSKLVGSLAMVYQMFNFALSLKTLLSLIPDIGNWAWGIGTAIPILSIGNNISTYLKKLEAAHKPNQKYNSARLLCSLSSTLGITLPIMSFYTLSLIAMPKTLGFRNTGLTWSGAEDWEKAALGALAIYNLACLGQFTASLMHVATTYTAYTPGNTYNKIINGCCKGKLGYLMLPNFIHLFTTNNAIFLNTICKLPLGAAIPVGAVLAALGTSQVIGGLTAGNPHGTHHLKVAAMTVRAGIRMRNLAEDTHNAKAGPPPRTGSEGPSTASAFQQQAGNFCGEGKEATDSLEYV